MPWRIQYHQMQFMMSSDVIIDTVPCLPYRRHIVSVPSSSRPHLVIISYRIPDNVATQSITYDIGYQLAPLLSPPNLIALLLHAPLPAEPCRPTGRLKARRHLICYSFRFDCLTVSSHLIGSSHRPLLACLVQRTPSPSISSISSAHRLRISPTPHRTRRATSGRNGARD